MVLLLIVFFVLTIFSFGVILFVMRPTADEKSMNKRIVKIKVAQGGFGDVADSFDQYLSAPRASTFSWLDELVASSAFSEKTRLLILQADSSATVGSLIIYSAVSACVVLIATYAIFSMLPLSVGLALVAGWVPFGLQGMRRRRRVAAFNKSLPDCVDMMSRSLRAGHSLVAAISIVAEQALEPNKTEFGEVFKKQNYGLPLREALLQMLDRVPSQDLRVLITGILVQKDTGGNLTEILDRIVSVVRERMRIQGEIRTHTAQGRLTGWILTALPVVMLLAINVINPGYSRILFTDPFGHKLLYAGATLLALGGLIIRQIMNGIEV